MTRARPTKYDSTAPEVKNPSGTIDVSTTAQCDICLVRFSEGAKKCPKGHPNPDYQSNIFGRQDISSDDPYGTWR